MSEGSLQSKDSVSMGTGRRSQHGARLNLLLEEVASRTGTGKRIVLAFEILVEFLVEFILLISIFCCTSLAATRRICIRIAMKVFILRESWSRLILWFIVADDRIKSISMLHTSQQVGIGDMYSLCKKVFPPFTFIVLRCCYTKSSRWSL